MTLARIILMSLAIIPLALFIQAYGQHSPWRSTLQGRVLMAQKVAMLAVLTHGVVSVVWPHYPGREIVSIVLFAVLIVLFWAMYFALRSAQAESRNHKKRERP